jgi:hypothetical protein
MTCMFVPRQEMSATTVTPSLWSSSRDETVFVYLPPVGTTVHHTKCSDEKLSQHHFVHHKPHTKAQNRLTSERQDNATKFKGGLCRGTTTSKPKCIYGVKNQIKFEERLVLHKPSSGSLCVGVKLYISSEEKNIGRAQQTRSSASPWQVKNQGRPAKRLNLFINIRFSSLFFFFFLSPLCPHRVPFVLADLKQQTSTVTPSCMSWCITRLHAAYQYVTRG